MINIKKLIISVATVTGLLFWLTDDTNNTFERIKTYPSNSPSQLEIIKGKKILVEPTKTPQFATSKRSNAVSAIFLEKSEECEVYEIDGGAVVIAKSGDDIRMSQLNSAGTGLSMKLPFFPTAHSHFIKRWDGSLLSIVSDLRLNSKVTRSADSDEPVMVYLDNKLIFESTKAYQVGVTSDGSSFYVIKPNEWQQVELIIHDVETHFATTHDLSHLYDQEGSDSFYYSSNTLSDDAIWLATREEGMEDATQYLYPLDGSTPITIEGHFNWRRQPFFYSVNRAFIINNHDKGSTITFVDIPTYLSNYKKGAIWEISMPEYNIDPSAISTYGNKVLLNHLGIRVLDIETGDEEFYLSESVDEQRRRLRWGENIGHIYDARLTGKGIQVLRQIGLEYVDFCASSGKNYKECLNTMRAENILYDVVDTFDKNYYGYDEIVTKSDYKQHGRCDRGSFSMGEIKSKNDDELLFKK